MRERIGQLDCLVRPGENEKNCFILLHGFGADAGDLFPLADFLDPNGEWSFYVPNAPLEVPIGPGWTGRGWFPISLRDLEAGVDFTQIRPPGMDLASQLMDELIFLLEPEKLVLGGFSQGAMVSTEVAMNNAEQVSGLVLYSGVLLDQANWIKKAQNLKGKKFIESHGTMDTVLPFVAGQRLFELLKAAGADGQFISFPGAHEIPVPVLKKTQEFLRGL